MATLSSFTLRIPDDLKLWLAARAEYNASSLNSEIVRTLRDRMDRETTAARTT